MGFVAAQRGAAWLSADTHSAEVLTPEKLSAEHRLIAQTAAEFVRTGFNRVSTSSSGRIGRSRGD
jgi:hypothetical protein